MSLQNVYVSVVSKSFWPKNIILQADMLQAEALGSYHFSLETMTYP